MIETVKDPEIMKVLLNHRPICPVTPEVLYNLSKQRANQYWIHEEFQFIHYIRLLLDHETNMRITPIVLSAVLNTNGKQIQTSLTQKLVEHLFERNNELEVTESTIKEAKRPEVLKVLLHNAPNMNVTPEMLSAAAPTEKCSHFTRLPKQDVLLDRGPDLQIPSDSLWPLIKVANQHSWIGSIKEHLELFGKHNKRIGLSRDMRKALDGMENVDPELKALMYKIGIQTDYFTFYQVLSRK
ncbi:MAG: hypothetical protein Q9209_003074 [Squamulea sp. 1 TL-2023]